MCLCSYLLLSAQGSAVAAEKSPEPIKILLNDWSSQLVLAYITAHIFQELGYIAEFVPSAVKGQWWRLSNGQADVQVEVWEGSMAKKYHQLLDAKVIVDAGNHTATTREEWWYPDYVEKLCPGLPSWTALKNCPEIFSTPSTAPRGRYLGGPWERQDRARIRALGLPFEFVEAKDGDALWLELELAISQQRPIMLFNWSPNWVEGKYAGAFVEFPKHMPECETHPEWGVNDKFPWDCGNPKQGWLKKVAQADFPKKWPCAFQALRSINFSNAMLSEVAAWVDVDKMGHAEAAQHWLTKYPGIWHKWLPSACEN